MKTTPYAIPTVLSLAAALLLAQGCGCGRDRDASPHEDDSPSAEEIVEEEPKPDIYAPVRAFPESFPRRSHLPDVRETVASGAISNSLFSPGRGLVYVDDPRVWWESGTDGETDDECDHSMHAAAELPFRRLVEMCVASGATLRVQEAYRPQGIHAGLSLHKEGRALDLTCPTLDPDNPDPLRPSPKSLEILAKLAWAAGFDWVFYECPKNSGPHIHASIRRDGGE